jgi:zinc transport system substrate-binding protein
MSRFFALCVLALISSLSWSQNLVVSTHPIYLIAQEITQGIEKPVLLLADQTGHDVTLIPVHRKLIQEANLIIWLGKAHEAPLDKLLSNNPKAISILASEIVQVLPQRNTRGMALNNTVDTHVWLDPNNAVRIGFFIAALRSQQVPEHKEAYWANAKRFAQKMLLAAQHYNTQAKTRPYWSYHDAYQYLERALNLKFAGALTDDPHVAPTIAQIKYLNQRRPNRTMCLLAEGHASKNQYQRLNPITFQAVDERMNGANDFVLAWKELAAQTHKCVLNTQK